MVKVTKEEWKPRAVKVSFHQRRPLTYSGLAASLFRQRETLYGSFPRKSRSSSSPASTKPGNPSAVMLSSIQVFPLQTDDRDCVKISQTLSSFPDGLDSTRPQNPCQRSPRQRFTWPRRKHIPHRPDCDRPHLEAVTFLERSKPSFCRNTSFRKTTHFVVITRM